MFDVLIENELKFVFEQYRNVPNVEIEIRLGWYNIDHFNTNIGKKFFDTIFKLLNNHDPLQENIYKSESKTDVYTHGKTRIIYDIPQSKIISCHNKIKVYTSDILLPGTPFDIRISVSVEKPIPNPIDTLDLKILNKVRSRERTQFSYKMWKYDLTKVKSVSPSCKYAESCNTYEFEIEFDPTKCGDVSNAYLARSLRMKILDVITTNPNESIILQNSLLKHCVKKRIFLT